MAGRVWAVFGMLALAGCVAPLSAAPMTSQLTLLQAPVAAAGLIGSTPAILNAEFGAPVLRRVDGTAQVWLYHSNVCGLNLILYPDAAGTPRVAAAVQYYNDPARCTASLQRGSATAGLEPPAAS